MIRDFALQVSTAQDVTATAVSTNSIDLSSAASAGHLTATVGGNPQAIGTGKILPLVIEVTTLAATSTSVAFEIITATDAALTTSIEVLGTSDVYLVAVLTVGRQPIVVHPNADPGNAAGHNQRYLGVRYIVAGAAGTGAYTAGFQEVFQDARIFPASTST